MDAWAKLSQNKSSYLSRWVFRGLFAHPAANDGAKALHRS